MGLTVALHPRVTAAYNHDDHAGGTAPVEQVGHEWVGGLELRERVALGLCFMQGEGQEEDKGGQKGTTVTHLPSHR
jgi:hypothetical protein